MGQVYASRDSWPFTYHVYPNVKEFMDDGGELLGPEDLPMEQIEYADRLARAVKSAKGFDGLVEVSPDNIKLAFTTEVVKPLRLVRPPPSYEDDEERSLEDWGVLEPEASVVCQVTDDSPEWIKRNRGAQDSYGRSILKAIGASFNPTSTIELELETTADMFVQDTKTYEHLLFRHAAYTAASQVSFMKDGGHTDESLLLEMEMNGVEADENDPIVDGHLVKAAWLDPSMFDALTGKPPRGREYYTKRFLEYGDSIKVGLATMRRELEQGSEEVDGFVTTEAREWGTWTQ
ncbi:hypothetical protein B9479_005401 [Cryptococcus floricola]|uniref:Uncharacterized protein n=1 Tax=Cryptococcus floricola TaxID=2591691 RepID=A0A5D3AVT4_9TREE|nr:hypothetical protein B9479_005401 [Cryptococcus floricola]